MKLVHLVGFIIKKFVTLHRHMNVKFVIAKQAKETYQYQGRIKLFGAPRQWKNFHPLFQAVFLSGGVLPPADSQTPRLPVPRQK